MKTISLYTKEQLLQAFQGWGVYSKMPTKGKAVFVAFPKPASPNLVRITLAPHKSTYGKSLYSVEMITL